MSLENNFKSIFSISEDDGDELRRPTRTTPRPPANTPEDELPVAKPSDAPELPRLEDLNQIAPVLLALVGAAVIAYGMYAMRNNNLRFA